MVTLQQLANELSLSQFDEIVGGLYHRGDVKKVQMEQIWGWTITTVGGTSGGGGNTWTTDKLVKAGGPCDCERSPEEPYEIGYLV